MCDYLCELYRRDAHYLELTDIYRLTHSTALTVLTQSHHLKQNQGKEGTTRFC